MVFPQLVFDFFDYKIGCTFDVDVGAKLPKSIFFIMQFNVVREIHILSNISDSIYTYLLIVAQNYVISKLMSHLLILL